MKYRFAISMICCAVTVGVLGSHYTSQAQPAKDSSYEAMSDKFFVLLQQNKSSEAVDFMMATNPAMKKIPDEIDQLKSQFGSLGPMMGPYISRVKLGETKVAGMYVYQHYFVAYERQPISVRIEYYKPGATWMCYGLQFDAKLTQHIQQISDDKISLDDK